jgi:hypothetical protein
VRCATDQGDPSIYGNLLFISAESPRSRNDCGMEGVEDGADRMRGVRIFDVSNPRSSEAREERPDLPGLAHPHDRAPPVGRRVIYIYVGGSSGVRSSEEMAGCSSGSVAENPNTSQFRVDIIRVPLANPEAAEVVTYCAHVRGAGARGKPGRSVRVPRPDLLSGVRPGGGRVRELRHPAGCSDPENPVRLDALSDENFSLWHTAVFSNDAKTVVFTDEWGGGTLPRCRARRPVAARREHGPRASIAAKLHAARLLQDAGGADRHRELRVAQRGLIPVPGRDIMVQGWYQGGVNVFEFTDPDNPVEIAYFDRGPVDAETLVVGGSWGAYWYNGYIYSSELSRGLDVLELIPSEFLSENELEAAKLVIMEEYNPQSQPKLSVAGGLPGGAVVPGPARSERRVGRRADDGDCRCP